MAAFEKPKGDPSAFLKPATTVLSPHLKFGCLSPRLFYQALQKVRNQVPNAALLPCPCISQAAFPEPALVRLALRVPSRCQRTPGEQLLIIEGSQVANHSLRGELAADLQGEEGAHKAAGEPAGAAALARVLLLRRGAHAQLPPHGGQPHLQADRLVCCYHHPCMQTASVPLETLESHSCGSSVMTQTNFAHAWKRGEVVFSAMTSQRGLVVGAGTTMRSSTRRGTRAGPGTPGSMPSWCS